jgi:hypothetical protein
MSPLKGWSHEKFGDVTKEIGKLRKKLENMVIQGTQNDQAKLMNTRLQLDELLEREELMWLQHSRIAWLKEGDRNTKYFHRKVAHRVKKNKIKMLRIEDGQIISDKVQMEGMARDFSKNLYTADPHVVLRTYSNPLMGKFQMMTTGIYARSSQMMKSVRRYFESAL